MYLHVSLYIYVYIYIYIYMCLCTCICKYKLHTWGSSVLGLPLDLPWQTALKQASNEAESHQAKVIARPKTRTGEESVSGVVQTPMPEVCRTSGGTGASRIRLLRFGMFD